MSRMVSSATRIKQQQRGWAAARGIAIDAQSYTLNLNDNLFMPLSEGARLDFEDGDGDELGTSESRGKMQALHSSSALACNAFDYWRDGNLAVLTATLGLSSEIMSIEFERKFPTGLQGNSPNLDVVLNLADGSIVAIESKFLEPFGRSHTPGFTPSYFLAQPGLWSEIGCANCQDLAERLQSGDIAYRWLHAEQLLKHILGIVKSSQEWALLYLSYRPAGPDGAQHAREADEFARIVLADGIRFRAISYQSFWASMHPHAGRNEQPYLAYMTGRYLEPSD